MPKRTIGFIGLGAMGNHMAKNLIKGGYGLTVYDLNPQPVQALVSAGAREAKSCADAARGVEALIARLLWQGAGAWTGFGPSAPFLFGAALALLAGILFIRLVK